MYWRHLCEFKTLPTYILFLSVLWKKYFVFRSRRKMKKKKIKSSQNKYHFVVFLDITIMKENINSFSIPSLNYYLPYLCLSFKKQKLSKLQRQKKIIPVKKIRKLDFDIILITYLLYMALMLCFGQNISFSVLQDSADQYIHLSTNYYFQIWLFLPGFFQC